MSPGKAVNFLNFSQEEAAGEKRTYSPFSSLQVLQRLEGSGNHASRKYQVYEPKKACPRKPRDDLGANGMAAKMWEKESFQDT